MFACNNKTYFIPQQSQFSISPVRDVSKKLTKNDLRRKTEETKCNYRCPKQCWKRTHLEIKANSPKRPKPRTGLHPGVRNTAHCLYPKTSTLWTCMFRGMLQSWYWTCLSVQSFVAEVARSARVGFNHCWRDWIKNMQMEKHRGLRGVYSDTEQ